MTVSRLVRTEVLTPRGKVSDSYLPQTRVHYLDKNSVGSVGERWAKSLLGPGLDHPPRSCGSPRIIPSPASVGLDPVGPDPYRPTPVSSFR